jgi:hypothetical protein
MILTDFSPGFLAYPVGGFRPLRSEVWQGSSRWRQDDTFVGQAIGGVGECSPDVFANDARIGIQEVRFAKFAEIQFDRDAGPADNGLCPA